MKELRSHYSYLKKEFIDQKMQKYLNKRFSSTIISIING